MQEKNAISDLANIGAYGFLPLLFEYILPVLDSPQGTRNQYFLSNTINKMIETSAAGFVAKLAEDCAHAGRLRSLSNS